MSVCGVRCCCSGKIQSAYTRYQSLLRRGVSVEEALYWCGLPRHSAFSSEADSVLAPTPPPVCCRADLMCNIDMTLRHNVLDRIVRWAEGPHRAPTASPSLSKTNPAAPSANALSSTSSTPGVPAAVPRASAAPASHQLHNNQPAGNNQPGSFANAPPPPPPPPASFNASA